MKRIIKTLVSIVLVSFSLSSGKGQNPSPPPPQVGDRIRKNIVSIYNQSTSQIKILLGDSISGMDTFILKGQETWNSPEYQVNPVVKIKTGNHLTDYTLALGFSYILFWNDEKKYWDLKKNKN